MLDLGLSTPEEYLGYLEVNQKSETGVLVSLLTTHHTYFFREFSHFEYMEKTALPVLIESLRKKGRKNLRIWSAACSRGKEAYSLSMFLAVHLPRLAPDFTYEIVGTDVDPESVGIAQNGVYRFEEVKSVPAAYMGSHWSRGTGDIAEFVKAKKSIKDRCSFRVGNLIELSRAPDPKESELFDIIFCRNVFIYFTPEQIKSISKTFLKYLNPDGYLALGLSESIHAMKLPVELVGPSMYRRTDGKPKATEAKKGVAPVIAIAPAKPIRVLCVDDSSTVLTLFKKIFGGDPGFEMIGTAMNGLEAAKKVAELKPDVVTLDIHMPEQNGIEYLEKNFNDKHPPVIIVSSVSREESGIGIRALQLGAADYVEKPKLSDLEERADEIRTKIRCAFQVKALVGKPQGAAGLAKSFEKKVQPKDPKNQLRILIASAGDMKKVDSIINQLSTPNPATLVLVWGANSMLSSLSRSVRTGSWGDVTVMDAQTASPVEGKLYFGDLKEQLKTIEALSGSKQCTVSVLGEIPKWVFKEIRGIKAKCWIVEDMGFVGSAIHLELKKTANYFVPATSIAFHLDESLS